MDLPKNPKLNKVPCWCSLEKGIFDPICPGCVDKLWEWANTAQSIVRKQEEEIRELKKALKELVRCVDS